MSEWHPIATHPARPFPTVARHVSSFSLLLSFQPAAPRDAPGDRRTCRRPSTTLLLSNVHQARSSLGRPFHARSPASGRGADELLGTYRCQTFLAYSRREYDRTAIIVTAPSECALPARGCPGRTHYPIAVSSTSSYPPCTSERAGRRTERCQTPGPSRSSSRNRTQCAPIGQISPPPSPSYYAPHIFYTAGMSSFSYPAASHVHVPRRQDED